MEKIFLVEVTASVYDNNTNFIVIAENKEEAEQIVKEEQPIITEDANDIEVRELLVSTTRKSNFREYRPNGKGIIHEYRPRGWDE